MDTWTIKKTNGKFQPRHNGLEIGIAHETEQAARIFIACQIHYSSPDEQRKRDEARNQAYRDFDLC